jgi:hypothetical protein
VPSVHADLGWNLEMMKKKYGTPYKDKVRHKPYANVLFRLYFLHGTEIAVGVQKIDGTWRSAWESYVNFTEEKTGYKDGRPVFENKKVKLTANELGRRLAANTGKSQWSKTHKAEKNSDGVEYVVLPRLDGKAFAVMNDNILYVTTVEHYPTLRKQLKLPEQK